MSVGHGLKHKFTFTARVEYVTEELDHAGHLFYMFNIKVVAESDELQNGPLQWSVIKSEDDFLQTHKVLRQKYGLLKGFQFRNPSAIGSNMFHLTHAVKPRKEKKDEYLSLILALDPIPDEIVAFLCLDNASYFITKADGTTVLEGSQLTPVSAPERAAAASRSSTPLRQRGTVHTAVATPVDTPAKYIVHTPSVVATPAPALSRSVSGSRAGRQWWQNLGLIASCLVVYTSAYFASTVIAKVGNATGISSEGSIAMLVYTALASALHNQLLFVRARLEVVIIVVALWLYTHRILGYGLGLFLRSKLDPNRSGKFGFHVDWIGLRLGLDQNMVVVHGFEWRNPVVFKNTPYLLRIDEISIIVDALSLYRAFMQNKAIRVKEIRFNKVTLYLEKLSGTTTATVVDDDKAVTAVEESGKEAGREARRPQTLKAGVLNLWAAMGATDAQQEASMLSSVSGQMDSAADGERGSVVGAVGAAVAKYNPASLLLKGGKTVGSTIGSTFGAGVGMLSRGMTRKVDTAHMNLDADDDDEPAVAAGAVAAAGGSGHDVAALSGALDESLKRAIDLETADSFDEYDASGDEPPTPPGQPPKQTTASTPNAHDSAAAVGAPAGGSAAKGSTATSISSSSALATEPSKKGFGFPYQLDIDALQLDRLELHAQDFLNASHSSQLRASVIKLKSLSMSHRDLSKPPKSSDHSNPDYLGKRRPLYLDDVVWRLVNKLLAELLKHNSIAMMVLLSSAAANNATSVVTSAGSLAYAGASGATSVVTGAGSLAYAGVSTGGKLLTRAGSVFLGPGGSHSTQTSHAAAPAPAHTTTTTAATVTSRAASTTTKR